MSKYAPQPGRIPGTLLNLSGVELVMPPLNLNQVQQYQKDAAEQPKPTNMHEQVEQMLPIIHGCLVRNHPDLTMDDLRGLLDMSNINEVSKALFTSSGFVLDKEGGK